MNVPLITPRLDAKYWFCNSDGGTVGLIWGGNAAFMLFIGYSQEVRRPPKDRSIFLTREPSRQPQTS